MFIWISLTSTPSNGYTYCLTMIDCFSKWPEAQPLKDIIKELWLRPSFLLGVSLWNSEILTTDRGRQFESSSKLLANYLVFRSVVQLIPPPQANGMIGRIAPPIESAIKCHATERWTEVPLSFPFGLRASLKEDILCTPAELVFGTTIRLSGEMFDSSKPDDEASEFCSET
ncbi:integrase catalytic domain-containing protein [Trichonephila clavipes]|nr:integrase catalytic domain-containing protein [Trichonephila clavipes]